MDVANDSSQVVTLLHDVKTAELDKSQAIAKAREEADAIVTAAEAETANVEQKVRLTITAGEEEARAAIRTQADQRLSALDAWKNAQSQRLQTTAQQNHDSALAALQQRFFDDWLKSE